MTTLEKIKLSLRTSHDKLDEDIQADIDTALADLKMHGVIHKDESDPLIFNAVKLYCKSLYTDDPAKGAAYRDRYFGLRDCLKVAEGYGWEDSDE
jgi:hypothetical protein